MFKRSLVLTAILILACLSCCPLHCFAVQEIGVFDLTAYDQFGNRLWHEEAHNALSNQGQNAMLDIYLRGATAPSSFSLGVTDSTPPCSIAKTDDLAAVVAYGEPSGNGYSRQTVEHSNTGWPTLALDSGDYMATSKTVTFRATGGTIGPVYCMFMTDGTNHILWAALSTGRTLADGETLDVYFKQKLQ